MILGHSNLSAAGLHFIGQAFVVAGVFLIATAETQNLTVRLERIKIVSNRPQGGIYVDQLSPQNRRTSPTRAQGHKGNVFVYQTPKYLITIIGLPLLVIAVCATLWSQTTSGLADLRLIIAAIGGMICLTIAPNLMTLRKRRKELETTLELLPETLDRLSRLLKSGHTILSALDATAIASPKEIKPIIQTISKEITHGKQNTPYRQLRRSERKITELDLLDIAIAAQYHSGGQIAQTIENVSALIKSKNRLRRRIMSITAEARWSGRLLSAAPIFAAITVNLVNPDYYAQVAEKESFPTVCAAIILLLIINYLAIQHITRLKP